MSYAFAGTPRFASLVLRELIELGRTPALVISQPDRPRGRGRSTRSPHAVVEADCHGLDCVQSDDINAPQVAGKLRSAGVTTLAVASFGQLLSPALLECFTCVNIHASLLPSYRGAAPVERAIMAGERVTGVSIMRITECLDEGPWAEKVEVSVGLRQDAGSLLRVLAVTGAAALVGVFDAIEDGTVRWREQEGEATYAHKLGTADWWLDLSKEARRAHDQVRALSPAVGARAILGEKEIKVWRSWPYGGSGLGDVPEPAQVVDGRSGEAVGVAGRLFMGCGSGVLEVMEIQPASRGRMSAAAYLRGYGGGWSGTVKVGSRGPGCGED